MKHRCFVLPDLELSSCDHVRTALAFLLFIYLLLLYRCYDKNTIRISQVRRIKRRIFMFDIQLAHILYMKRKEIPSERWKIVRYKNARYFKT